jgi:hypothetical protein
MKKLILFTVIIINCIQLSVAQKIYLNYKIKTKDSLLEFQDKAISDKNIETNAQNIFRKHVPNSDMTSIEDNLNRKFVKLEINHETYYLKLLNKGFYTLYEQSLGNDSRYYSCSKTDTVVLEKNDSSGKQSDLNLNLYTKLASISKDYPELWPEAKKVKFDKKGIQGFISVLNLKYPETSNETHSKSRFDYLSISLKGFILEDKTDLMIDVLKSHYFIGHSTNISLRYGIKANYYQLTEFFPESWTGWYTIQNGQKDSIFNYRDHYETLTAEILELPFSVNFEITNSIVTPYLNTGLAPAFYYRTISSTDSEEIDKMTKVTFNAFAAAGVKLKLKDNFNIMSEYRWDLIKGLNFLLGLEYFFHPHKHL